MKLKIQTITGVTHKIEVEERWTIKEVKVSNSENNPKTNTLVT